MDYFTGFCDRVEAFKHRRIFFAQKHVGTEARVPRFELVAGGIWLSFVRLAVFAAAFTCEVAQGAKCNNAPFDNHPYIVCEVNLATEELEVFQVDDNGTAIGSLQRLDQWLGEKGRKLVFGMNGGIFKPSGVPVGLLVVRGTTVNKIDLKGWPGFPKETGNFYAIPNAVFWIKDRKARIQESLSYDQDKVRSKVDMAIQSGPMLVRSREIPNDLTGYNKKDFKRNGVCVISPSELRFVISDVEVSIHEFARFMRDHLKCSDALYLDGCRSVLFSANLKRSDKSCKDTNDVHTPLGAFLAVVESRPAGSER